MCIKLFFPKIGKHFLKASEVTGCKKSFLCCRRDGGRGAPVTIIPKFCFLWERGRHSGLPLLPEAPQICFCSQPPPPSRGLVGVTGQGRVWDASRLGGFSQNPGDS